MEKLPIEVLENIFRYLDGDSMDSARETCKL